MKVTQDVLNQLPPNKVTTHGNIKEETNLDRDDDSLLSTSTILYSWMDELILQVIHILDCYKKPKYKLPDSLKSQKLNEMDQQDSV